MQKTDYNLLSTIIKPISHAAILDI